jgi:hypothetical protein
MNPGGSKIPPEEKLLKLIRGKAQPMGAPAASGHPAPAMASVGSARAAAGPPSWLVPMLNVLLVGAAAALVWLTVAPVPEMPAVPAELPSGTDADEAPPEPEPMPLLSGAVSRPLFDVPDRTSAETPSAAEAAQSNQEMQAMASALNLIGVVSGESPQAIIEDAQHQKTSFVSVGQTIGGFTVEEVHENKVILSLNGKKIELSL